MADHLEKGPKNSEFRKPKRNHSKVGDRERNSSTDRRKEEKTDRAYKQEFRRKPTEGIVIETIGPIGEIISRPIRNLRVARPCAQCGEVRADPSPMLTRSISDISSNAAPLLKMGWQWVDEADHLDNERRRTFYERRRKLRDRTYRDLWGDFIPIP